MQFADLFFTCSVAFKLELKFSICAKAHTDRMHSWRVYSVNARASNNKTIVDSILQCCDTQPVHFSTISDERYMCYGNTWFTGDGDGYRLRRVKTACEFTDMLKSQRHVVAWQRQLQLMQCILPLSKRGTFSFN